MWSRSEWRVIERFHTLVRSALGEPDESDTDLQVMLDLTVRALRALP